MPDLFDTSGEGERDIASQQRSKVHFAISDVIGKVSCRRRPYRVECTGSLLTSEVKQRRAWSVLGWGTAWEDLRVLSAFSFHTPCTLMEGGMVWLAVVLEVLQVDLQSAE